MRKLALRRTATAKAALSRLAVVIAALGVLGGAEAVAAARHASLVVDANTGRTLHAQAADELRYPASLTKMMTLYIVFELLEQRRLDPSTRIRISETAAATPPSRLGLAAGGDIALGEAVRAIITKSANDIAVALAEHIAGSEAKFARLMTRKAHALGMTATVFKNAHGLTDPDQVTTARDMVTLALRLNDDFPRYYRLFSIRAFSYNGTSYRNHNTLLGNFEGTDGIKTGYTAASGFNLAASVRRDGKHVVGVVFGGSSAATRNVLMRALLRRGLAQASTVRTRKPVLVAKATGTNGAATQRHSERRGSSRRTALASRTEAEALSGARHGVANTALTQPLGRADEAPEPQLRGPPIEIARVRPVLLAPRARPARAEIEHRSTLSAAGTDASATGQPPDLADRRLQSGLGAAPSSLVEQAERIARGQPALMPSTAALPERLYPSTHNVSATAAEQKSFVVQVGAYSSQAEALRRLQAMQSRANDLLGGRSPVSQPVQHAGKQLYRARFSGFDQQSAASTCQELKRRQIDCHVAKIE